MVVAALVLTSVSAFEVAVMVTLAGVVRVGTVKAVLTVVGEENGFEPQVAAGAQLQVMPELVGSPAIWARSFMLGPLNTVGGGGVTNETVGTMAVMVTVALALTALSATEVTVMVTFPAMEGAV